MSPKEREILCVCVCVRACARARVCLIVYDPENSTLRQPRPELGCCVTEYIYIFPRTAAITVPSWTVFF